MFCNRCGNQVKDEQQYCGVCGAYIKKEALPIQENINRVKLPKEELVTWVKQGLIYAGILTLMSILICFLGESWLRENMCEGSIYSYYSADWSSTQKNFYNTIINGGAIIFSYLFGGKMVWKLSLGNDISGSLFVEIPFVGMIITVLMIILSEKIRAKISNQKLTLLGTVVISIISTLAITLGGRVFRQSVKLGSDDLWDLGYYYDNEFDLVKLGSDVSGFPLFLIVLLMSFIVLNLMMTREDAKEGLIVSTIKKITYTLVGFSFLMVLGMVIKTCIEEGFMPEGAEYIVGCLLILYLTGVGLTMLITGQFMLMEMLINSESLLKLKAGLFNLNYSFYGIDDKTENFMKWWLIVGIFIVVIMVLTVAYQFWKERKLEVKSAAMEAGVISMGLGAIFSILVRMASLSMEIHLKLNHTDYRELIGIERNTYDLVMKSGNTSILGTWIIVALISFSVFMLMYWLINTKQSVVEMMIGYADFKVIWAIIIVFCMILAVQFDVYDINDSTTSFIQDAVENFGGEIDHLINSIF